MKALRTTSLLALVASLSAPTMAAEINTKNRLEIRSDDGQFSLRLSARVHADANFYNNEAVDHTSGAFIRRARIGLSGHLADWGYKIEYDNASDAPILQDAWLNRKLGPGKLTIGNFKQFESMEELTSSNDITFIERSHVANVVASRNIGVGYTGNNDSLGYGISVYNLRNPSDGRTSAIDEGHGFSGRAYFVPLNEDGQVLHLGVSYAMEKIDSRVANPGPPIEFDGDDGRIRVRPAGRSGDARFELADVRGSRANIGRLNLEAAAVAGPVSFQAEYLIGEGDPQSGADQDFSAYYATLSYMLTGESRRYDIKKGRFKQPRPNSANGAWELAARFQGAENDASNEDLNTVDVALNWYATQNVLFKVNYTTVTNDEQNPGNEDTDLLSLRAQWAF